jgi:hypothetical protein
MSIPRYLVSRSEMQMVLRRPLAWTLTGCVGLSFSIAGGLFGFRQDLSAHPFDRANFAFELVFLAFFAVVLFLLIRDELWRQRFDFDRKRDAFLINGRSYGVLSTLRIEWDVWNASSLPVRPGRFGTLSLRLANGRRIKLGNTWESSSEQWGELVSLAASLASFINVPVIELVRD